MHVVTLSKKPPEGGLALALCECSGCSDPCGDSVSALLFFVVQHF